jgi:hypothetical protein
VTVLRRLIGHLPLQSIESSPILIVGATRYDFVRGFVPREISRMTVRAASPAPKQLTPKIGDVIQSS